MRFTGKTLLTIDDEAALRRGFKDYFEDSDFKVLEAENGRVGVEIFRRQRPDVVLCDLRMPEMDGLEVIKIIAAEAPDTPLIVVSGTGLLEDATEAIRQGAWDYITKPVVDMAVVEHVVNKSLEKAELLAENRHYQARLETLLKDRTLELNRSKNLIETIFSAMPGLIFIYEQFSDGEFKLVQWNRAIEKQLGYSVQELEHSPVFKFLDEEHHELIMQRMKSVFRDNHKRIPIEIPLVCKDGSKIMFMFTACGAVFDGKNYLVGFGIDITDQKKVEKELLLLAAAIEQAAEEIIITDPEGLIQYVNPAFENVTGFSRSKALGSNPRILKSGVQNKTFYQELWGEITAGRTWRGRLVNKRADGTLFTEDVAISPVYDESGTNMGYVSVKKDITEQLKFEERQRQSQRMESIATLAGGIAHDFNNILAAIIGSNDIAMLYCKDNHKLETNLKRIDSAGLRAKELVQQILTFGRPEQEEFMTMQPALIVKEALKLLRASIPATIEIHSDIVSHKTIKADPTQIHQVVMNLCTNAFHAMRESGGVLGVELVDIQVSDGSMIPGLNLTPGSYLRLEVSDTGYGMSKETQGKIFMPYFTTKVSGDGTGLGLAVVHGIIENCGGTITVYSEVDEGTVFRVYLPTIHDDLSKNSEAAGSLTPPRGRGEMIMVVDDEKHMVEVYEEALKEYGYRVAVFQNGNDAYDAFKESPKKIDLLLSDMAMPGMNGKDLVKKVLALRPDLPVIINTGFSALLGREEALALGIAEYLQKPISLNEILRTIHHLLTEG